MPDNIIGVIGAGYTGLTTAAGLAHIGHQVRVLDTDGQRIAELQRGVVVLREPDLPELVQQGLRQNRLSFSTDPGTLAVAGIVFICVPTPMTSGGEADVRAVHAAIDQMRRYLAAGTILVLKSTAPAGTARSLSRAVRDERWRVLNNPEFLRESHAVADFLHATRIVIGAGDFAAACQLAGLYRRLDAPVQHMSWESAELAKYASNAFLAVKLSFANELAELCEQAGADITAITTCMGADSRIGPAFLEPGPGWGGSCLPKDTAALLHTAQDHGVALAVLEAAIATNKAQASRVLRKTRSAVGHSLHGARIGLLGIAFKAGTADLRDSPALAIAQSLVEEGALVTAYDPAIEPDDARNFPQLRSVLVAGDPYVTAKDAAALIIATEWPEFAALDWREMGVAMRHRTVVDTRNILDRGQLQREGFLVTGNGKA